MFSAHINWLLAASLLAPIQPWSVAAHSAATTITAGKISTVFQFGNYPTWIENLAVRHNNHILLTTIGPLAQVWAVDPGVVNGSATLIASFDGVTSALGITELGGDVFAVVAGSLGLVGGLTSVAGSYAIYTVDMRGPKPHVKKAVQVTAAQMLNGLTTLDAHHVLAADSMGGVVYRIDTIAGTYSVALDDATMKPGSNPKFQLGINGVRVVDDYLYYSNGNRGTLCRVRINRDGSAAGPFEVLVDSGPIHLHVDDFAVSPSGLAFVAGPNEIVEVLPDGSYSIFAGNVTSGELAGATSAQSGRGSGSNMLYVSTNGAQASPINGTFSEPGKIVAIEIRGLNA